MPPEETTEITPAYQELLTLVMRRSRLRQEGDSLRRQYEDANEAIITFLNEHTGDEWIQEYSTALNHADRLARIRLEVTREDEQT